MPIYFVTNKVTFARMVCIAATPDAAARLHPTNDQASRGRDDDEWHALRHVQGATFGYDKRVKADPPNGWPLSLELLHVEEIGHVVFERHCGVLAYETSEVLRKLGEGIDLSWGGYAYSALGQLHGPFARK